MTAAFAFVMAAAVVGWMAWDVRSRGASPAGPSRQTDVAEASWADAAAARLVDGDAWAWIDGAEGVAAVCVPFPTVEAAFLDDEVWIVASLPTDAFERSLVLTAAADAAATVTGDELDAVVAQLTGDTRVRVTDQVQLTTRLTKRSASIEITDRQRVR